ncbi:MAG: cupin domain-containing protein [Candidatus Bathyarchaeia archaeon]|jgi:quercetin dioxygenase-like cupin family protein
MKTIKIDEVKVIERSGGIFTGMVHIQSIVNETIESKDLNIAVVSFPAGVKNTFHTHNTDQLLWVLSGKGIVATEHEEVIATPGMAFFIPTGESHWHGATKDSPFSHISIRGQG